MKRAFRLFLPGNGYRMFGTEHKERKSYRTGCRKHFGTYLAGHRRAGRIILTRAEESIEG
jgi:hypothetical protein